MMDGDTKSNIEPRDNSLITHTQTELSELN